MLRVKLYNCHDCCWGKKAKKQRRKKKKTYITSLMEENVYNALAWTNLAVKINEYMSTFFMIKRHALVGTDFTSPKILKIYPRSS